MKRRTLDLIFSGGAMVFAGLLIVLAIVMTSNANFAKTYVRDQLAQENVVFKTADTLTAEEKAAPCLVGYAGQQMLTGKQAECYANSFIGLHVKSIAGGKTYADLGTPQTALKTQIAALAPTDPKVSGLQAQLTAVTAQRETLFKGETLRGLLLTSFGFSEFGAKAGQLASVAYGAAALMALLSIAGFAHALRTSKNEAFAPVEQGVSAREAKYLTAV